jgi:hypothetical protein
VKLDNERTDHQGRVLPSDVCPSCGMTLDSATYPVPGQEEHRPRPGDLSVCIHCAEVLMYGENMKVDMATVEHLVRAGREVRRQIGVVQGAVREIRKQKDA